jgi:tRNA A37 threonylcarbamoyladenosine modification protein TsaB
MTAQQFLQDFAPPNRPTWLLGDGLLYHKDEFLADSIHFFDQKDWSPHASKVHLLGWQLAQANHFADPLTLQPNYIRAPDVTLKKNT